MKYKCLLYISIPFLIISCGGSDKESALTKPVSISDERIGIRTPVPDEINNDMDDSDPIKSRVIAVESPDDVMTDIEDSDPIKSRVIADQSTDDSDIDDSDPVI
ncbi:MAG: hypothetical protein ACI95X_001303 [Paraglaciecola sp.]|jgi:hypothetical protein